MKRELKYLRNTNPKNSGESNTEWEIRLVKVHDDLIAKKDKGADEGSDKDLSTPPVESPDKTVDEETVVTEEEITAEVTTKVTEYEKVFSKASEKGLSILDKDEMLILVNGAENKFEGEGEIELLGFILHNYKNKLTLGEPLPNRVMIKAHFKGYKPGEACLVDQKTYDVMKKCMILMH